MVELRQLRQFVAVCEELHFRRAAERLHMTQPPLTQSIQAMEQELGVTLFNRSRRHVAMTKAGEILLVEARATLDQAARLAMAAQHAARGAIGTLRIGFSISASFVRPFTQAVHAFRLAHPRVVVDLSRTSASAGLGALEQGRLDLCVTRPFHPIRMPGTLEHAVIQRDRLMLILQSGHFLADRRKLSLAAVVDEPFIVYPRDQGTAIYQQVMDLWTSVKLLPQVTQELGDGPTIMALVAAGLGVSVLPSSLQVIQIGDIVWREIEEDERLTDSAVAVVYAKANQGELLHASFIELITSFAQAQQAPPSPGSA